MIVLAVIREEACQVALSWWNILRPTCQGLPMSDALLVQQTGLYVCPKIVLDSARKLWWTGHWLLIVQHPRHMPRDTVLCQSRSTQQCVQTDLWPLVHVLYLSCSSEQAAIEAGTSRSCKPSSRQRQQYLSTNRICRWYRVQSTDGRLCGVSWCTWLCVAAAVQRVGVLI